MALFIFWVYIKDVGTLKLTLEHSLPRQPIQLIKKGLPQLATWMVCGFDSAGGREVYLLQMVKQSLVSDSGARLSHAENNVVHSFSTGSHCLTFRGSLRGYHQYALNHDRAGMILHCMCHSSVVSLLRTSVCSTNLGVRG